MRPAGKKQNRNTGVAGSGKRKRRPQSAAKKDLKSNMQKAAVQEGQKNAGQATKQKKQGSPVPGKNRNTSAAAQARRDGVKAPKTGGGQKNSNRRGARKGPPKIHDDYDDIRSYGGRYLQLPDYDELETATLSSAGLFSLSVEEGANQDAAPISISDDQAPVAGRNAVRELLRSGRSID